MIDESEIMRALVFDDKVVRELWISKTQAEIVAYINNAGFTTTKTISLEFGIGINNASVQLIRLIRKGYLVRESKKTNPNKHHFIYYASQKLNY